MAPSLTRQQRVALKTWNPGNLQSLLAAYTANNPGYKPPNGMAPNVGGFPQFVAPTTPPPGTYDPSLDAQLAAAGRGYGDLQSQTGIDNQRAQDDFTLGSGHLQTLLDQALGDLSTGRTNAHTDYERAVGDLVQNYSRLGNRQAQGQAQATADGGASGALQQSLEKRMANEAHDRVPLDTAEHRSVDAYNTAVDRAKSGEAYDVGQLGLGLSRGNEDRANALGIAGRENAQFGTDIGAQRWFQATQMGYDPPQKPAGLHIDSSGRQSRLVKTRRGTRRLMSTGYLLGT